MTDPLDALGVAAARILRARHDLEEARNDRDAALVMIHKGGVRKCNVATTARNYLQLHGFEGDALSAVGVSPSSVRVALDHPGMP
jgi:hypothetical protein